MDRGKKARNTLPFKGSSNADDEENIVFKLIQEQPKRQNYVLESIRGEEFTNINCINGDLSLLTIKFNNFVRLNTDTWLIIRGKTEMENPTNRLLGFKIATLTIFKFQKFI